MASASAPANAPPAPAHSTAFRTRRFLNWFPMGLTYAFLYMGRYNLNVAKTALGDLMTKEDFGTIFSVGTFTYAFAFLLNGPLTDKIGGKRALLIGATGAGVMNLLMGLYLSHTLASGAASNAELRLVFSLLYAGNMYFQSYGAVAIVKVNAHWFHVRERGGFSGIFGTMISSGIFFAYTVNGWLLDLFTKGLEGSAKTLETRWVFLIPGLILLTMAIVEAVLLRDRPGQAGQQDFDTGDVASDGDADLSSLQLMKKILTHPVILTIAFVEFCTGVLRNGIMSWYPIYSREVLALPSSHPLVNGSWSSPSTIVPFFVLAAAFFLAGSRSEGTTRRALISLGGVLFLVPFMQGGWGGILMVAGVIGGNVAGYVSDLFFASRRAPAAGGLYALLCVCTLGMIFALGKAENLLSTAAVPGLMAGDRILAVQQTEVHDWVEARRAFACVPAACAGGAGWDEKNCVCTSHDGNKTVVAAPLIAVTVERGGQRQEVSVTDPAYRVDKTGTIAPRLRAGDSRELKAQPTLTRSPYLLGAIVFLISLCVIGTHGLLSGTATMDFGGKKGAATAVAMIDGFVYMGTGFQAVALGKITSIDWSYWPVFLFPFAIIGTLLLRRLWNVSSARQTTS